MALLEVDGIVKTFGKLTALDGAGLSVAENEFHGLIGPNGSGKTHPDEMRGRRRDADRR